jgi:DNA-binding response OmpR family regulator
MVAQEKKRILVVDDDSELQGLIQLLLSRINVESISALDVQAAVQILRDPPMPDMMILDLMLPGVSGIDFLRQLRARPAFDTLPVLVLSALVDPDQIREALEAGADRYLTKPYLANNLTTLVADLMRNGRRSKS